MRRFALAMCAVAAMVAGPILAASIAIAPANAAEACTGKADLPFLQALTCAGQPEYKRLEVAHPMDAKTCADDAAMPGLQAILCSAPAWRSAGTNGGKGYAPNPFTDAAFDNAPNAYADALESMGYDPNARSGWD